MKSTTMSGTAAIALLVASAAGPAAAAVPTDSTNLRNAVTVGGLREHQAALQAIADANGNTRASGTDGFDLSADYVAGLLEAAGYVVSRQEFDFPFFEELSPALFSQGSTVYGPTDFAIMEYSGSGDITAPIQRAGGIVIPATPAPSSASGCAASDFPSSTAGKVALVQRGTCTFAEKAANAEAAGAVAVIIFNEGQPGRQEALSGTLGSPDFLIPVIGASFAVGEDLYTRSLAGEVVVSITTETRSELLPTENVIAESPGGRSDRVVVVGAHLDSVPEGPGINDNGSGTAAILEVALQLDALNITPRNKLRFAFWGAEESGLLGSEYYVSQLATRDVKNIAVNLNFDMLGSPNFVRFVYDGDGSDTPDAGPNGSATIEDIFLDYFGRLGLPTEATAFDGRSDYGPFIDVGIPAGGLFSGAEELKTAEQAAVFGGTAGAALDPCYHQACDTFGNNNNTILDQFADATAHAVLQFAMTTSAVKGTSRANDRAVKRVPLESLAFRGGRAQK